MASGFVNNGMDGRMGGFWNSWKQALMSSRLAP
jgi:hypothetical protein